MSEKKSTKSEKVEPSSVGPCAVVIPALIADNPGDFFAVFDGDKINDSKGAFAIPLSGNGLAPPTHYAANLNINEHAYMAYRNKSATQFEDYVVDARKEAGDEPLNTLRSLSETVRISEPNANFAAFVLGCGLQEVVKTAEEAEADAEEPSAHAVVPAN